MFNPIRIVVFLFSSCNISVFTWLAHYLSLTYGYGSPVLLTLDNGLLVHALGQLTAPFNLPRIRLLSSKARGCRDVWNPSKACFVGIHLIALFAHSRVSTHVPGIQPFFMVLYHFVMAKLDTTSIKVEHPHDCWNKTWNIILQVPLTMVNLYHTSLQSNFL